MTDATDNPYHSPQVASRANEPSPKLLLWSIAAVFGAAIVGGLFGLSVGAALGAFVPGYYRSIFAGGGDPSFDPLSVGIGIGLGLTQGAAFGGFVGLILVAMFYWYRSRTTPGDR